jgi:hypothetical protein
MVKEMVSLPLAFVFAFINKISVIKKMVVCSQ